MDPRVEIAKALLNTCYVSDKAFEGVCKIVNDGAFSSTSGEPFDADEWNAFKNSRHDNNA